MFLVHSPAVRKENGTRIYVQQSFMKIGMKENVCIKLRDLKFLSLKHFLFKEKYIRHSLASPRLKITKI